MSFHQYRVKEIIEKIGRNDLYLPAIQRKFVWDCDQIERLFDSIMRGYPIGTFLFWFVHGEYKNDYTFYKFIQEYHERDRKRNEIAPKPELKEEVIGVLDGQQRLGALYIALQGTYAYKKPHARWENDSAFPKRKLYLNLLKQETVSDDGLLYEFKFLTEHEAKRVDENHLWFLVRDVLSWGEDPRIDEYYDHLLEEGSLLHTHRAAVEQNRVSLKRLLRKLHLRLAMEDLISYYKVEEQDLDDVLDIFVRVNSGGTILSKSDLLFSTIVANWEQARDEIETLLENINSKGDGFRFDNDFVMRACLVLSDSPVLFKVKGFKRENVQNVMQEWGNIRTAIENTVDFLAEFGFSGENLTSQNAVIPIAYYLKRGGSADSSSKKELRKYLICALLKQTFGGQGDQVLSNIRDVLRLKAGDSYELKEKRFSFDSLANGAKFPGARTLRITDEDIEDILQYRKGPYTFMVLSLLYPSIRLAQVRFHQDHIHPASLFTNAKLRTYGVSQDKVSLWQDLRDQLPNLQIMEGVENESKNRKPFKDWLSGVNSSGKPNVSDVQKFLTDNYIPQSVSLEFVDFEDFFTAREDILRENIRSVLF